MESSQSDSANSITIDIHYEIIASKANIQFMKVFNGSHDALDFQLSSYLGFLLQENKEREYIIISKDSGYQPLIKFWSQNFIVKQQNQLIAEEPTLLPTIIKKEEPKKEEIDKEEILQLLIKYSVDINWLLSTIEKYKTKVAINNAIVKKYKSENAKHIYKAIKPFLSDKK